MKLELIMFPSLESGAFHRSLLCTIAQDDFNILKSPAFWIQNVNKCRVAQHFCTLLYYYWTFLQNSQSCDIPTFIIHLFFSLFLLNALNLQHIHLKRAFRCFQMSRDISEGRVQGSCCHHKVSQLHPKTVSHQDLCTFRQLPEVSLLLDFSECCSEMCLSAVSVPDQVLVFNDSAVSEAGDTQSVQSRQGASLHFWHSPDCALTCHRPAWHTQSSAAMSWGARGKTFGQKDSHC